mmetsp:Transcript_4921/g.4102  ORF Transcript_4921/g.4102 Transcript_4921/m.4102 type:complete len:201 (-) Transcript_4921:842-1444(-)
MLKGMDLFILLLFNGLFGLLSFLLSNEEIVVVILLGEHEFGLLVLPLVTLQGSIDTFLGGGIVNNDGVVLMGNQLLAISNQLVAKFDFVKIRSFLSGLFSFLLLLFPFDLSLFTGFFGKKSVLDLLHIFNSVDFEVLLIELIPGLFVLGTKFLSLFLQGIDFLSVLVLHGLDSRSGFLLLGSMFFIKLVNLVLNVLAFIS